MDVGAVAGTSSSSSNAASTATTSRSTYRDPGTSISAKIGAESALPVVYETWWVERDCWLEEPWDEWYDLHADPWSDEQDWYAGEWEEALTEGL